jgi:hypothetical protein
VARLKTLAADVKGILGGGVKVSYAADWSDYNGYRPADGSNDVFFHLDPLWADSNIDFVGGEVNNKNILTQRIGNCDVVRWKN